MLQNSSTEVVKPRVVVAIVNTKSGERASATYILRNLREKLSASCVFDIFGADGKFNFGAIVSFVKTANPEVLIVAGGDGTVSLAIDVCEATGIPTEHLPFICVLPMGTGNDLSRTVGFGAGFSEPGACSACCCAPLPFDKTIDSMITAPRSSIDRWSIKFFDSPTTVGTGTGPELVFQRPVTMINYFSIGFDAHIAAKFAHFRNENPRLCERRLLNKVWYTCFGCQALCGEMILDKVVIIIDGKQVPTPPDLKSIVVSNVLSFASGVKLWSDSKGKYAPPRINDGLVEVQGVYGANHMALIQIGLRSAVKIGQGRQVVLRAPKCWCQFDGEALDELSDLAKSDEITIEISQRSVYPILSSTA
jgi:diacylglycerol kinase (ATP)